MTAVCSVGIAVGAGLAAFVREHNERATSRWSTASRAHDALIEITTLEALRAELVSASEFDRPRIIQLWREHQAKAVELLDALSIPEIDQRLVADAERWMSLYSAAANRHVSTIPIDPERAAFVSEQEVVPTFLRLQEVITELRVALDRLGPDAQRMVDRDLFALLPVLSAIAAVIAFGGIASRRRLAVQAAEAKRDARFKALVHGATDVLSVVDDTDRFTEVSESSTSLFGRSSNELIGRDVASLLVADDASAFIEASATIRETGRPLTLTVGVVHPDRRPRIVELTGSRPAALEGLAWVWHDVTAQRELAEQLRRQTFQDDLTGLANRALLRDRATMALAEPSSVAMLLVDIDRFQEINDALGHEVGDELLRSIAGRLRACVRPGDTVARLGSDEFAALLSGADARSVDAVVERVLESCRRPFTIDGNEVRATVSIGIATTRRGGDVEDLLRRADTALAIAKSKGRDRSQVHAEEMDQRARQRVALATELHYAVERQQLLAVYQPIVSLADGSVSGFESLLRWRHPEHGLVSPVDFIPLAEENGTIIAIGKWILDTAVERAAALPAPIRMNVNLSGRQLAHPQIVDEVRAALTRTGLAPERLVLEITESLLLEDTGAAMNVLHDLRSLGCLLAIDDFGTGYSSLGYLRRLPVNIVKLDKSFLDARLATSDGERAFLESVLQVGRSIGLETVAEGIEDVATASVLRSIGCDKGQGYLFSRPVEASATDALVGSNHAASLGTLSGVS